MNQSIIQKSSQMNLSSTLFVLWYYHLISSLYYGTATVSIETKSTFII